MQENANRQNAVEIVDAHVHVWDLENESYPWQPIGGYIPDFSGSPTRLLLGMSAAQISRAVIVAATPYGWDNRFVVDTLRQFPDRFAGVALINALAPDVQEMVRDWTLQGCHGVRLVLTDIEPWVPRPEKPQDLYPLWEIADALSIPICALMEPHSIPLIAKLLEKFPHVQVLFDDSCRLALGAPEGLRWLAEFDHCHAKLSGFWWHSNEGYPYSDMVEPIRQIIGCFGSRRVLWGGDWPWVENQGHQYSSVLNTCLALPFLTEDEKRQIVGENAKQLWFRHEVARLPRAKGD